jgi:glyceraldehyde 3-phosphate dehydrogenase
MAKVAINGLGRIGRATLKILMQQVPLELVAVNDIAPADNLMYLLRHDSVYGRYRKAVELQDKDLLVDGKTIGMLNEKDPAKLPWKEMNVDLVFESTGIFAKREDLELHHQAGARNVILSQPAKGGDVPHVVYGSNTAPEGRAIISCASCTTNCITPVVEVLGRRIGIKKAMMTTIHAYTATQQIVDGPSKKQRRGRAAAINFVPTSTGAAKATAKALPEFEGKFDGAAIRGPVPVGSIADITMVMEKQTSADEVNKVLREEAASERYKDVLGIADDDWTSTDVIGDPHASVVDVEMTQVVGGDLVKVMSWYDNEWGYAAQMVRQAAAMLNEKATIPT